jgi:hypothetical protein
MLTSTRRALAVVAAMAATLAGATHAVAAPQPFVFDGTVDTVAQQGPWTYVAGTFSRAAWPADGNVVLSTRKAAPVPITTPGDAGHPRIGDGAGGWFVSAPDAIRHVDAGGHTVWRTATDMSIRSLARSGNAIFLAGDFTSVGGTARAGLASIRTTDGRVLPWAPAVRDRGKPVAVTILGAAGGHVVLGGAFDRVAGAPRTKVASVDGVSGRASLLRLPPSDRPLTVAAVTADRLYVTGAFTSIAGKPRRSLAALDARTGQLLTWNPRLGGLPKPSNTHPSVDEIPSSEDVNGVVPAGPIVYISGRFTRAGGRTVKGIAALTATTARATRWAPAHTGPVQVLTAGSDHVYAVSRFPRDGVTPTTGWLAQLSPVTARPSGWDAGLAFGAGWVTQHSPLVSDVQLSGSRVSVRGSFYAAGAPLVRLGHLARLNGDGELDTGWRPKVGGPACAQPNARALDVSRCVTAVVAGPGTVYLGGAFARPRAGLAAVDATTGAVRPWSPKITGHGIPQAVTGDGVLLAGDMTEVDDEPQRGLAIVDPVTGRNGTVRPGLDGPVGAAAVNGSTAYLVGSFSHVGSAVRTGVAAIDLNTGSPTPWGTGTSVRGDGVALTFAPDAVYAETQPTGGTATTLTTLDSATGAVHGSYASQSGRTLVTVLGNRTYLQPKAFWYSVGTDGSSRDWNVDLDYPYGEASVTVYGRKAMASTGTRLALAGAFSRTYDPKSGASTGVTGPFALSDPLTGAITPTTLQIHEPGADRSSAGTAPALRPRPPHSVGRSGSSRGSRGRRGP